MDAIVNTLSADLSEKGIGTGEELKEYLFEQFEGALGFCLRVVFAIVIFWIGRKLVRWILRTLRRSLEKASVDTGVIQFACSLAWFLLYALLIFSVAVTAGVEESSVAALLASAGVTLGLALQGGLSNLAGGVIILMFKPFQVGDYIIQDSQNGCEGTVISIDICYTTLLSLDNKQIVVPNGTLSNSTIFNGTAQEQRKLEIRVSISYDSDIQKAKAILASLLAEDPDTKADPAPQIFVDELGGNGVVLMFRVCVPTKHYLAAKWRMNEKIKEAFDAGGIRIPYNQLEVYLEGKRL